jgi:signal transduction histidine kinase
MQSFRQHRIFQALFPRRTVVAAARHPIDMLWILRAALLGLALLVPLNLAFSVPPVGQEAMLGWSSELHRHGEEEVFVVTRMLRSARVAGLRPGDELTLINGRGADAATLQTLLAATTPGDTIRLQVRRANAVREVQVVAASASASYHGLLVYMVVIALASWLVALAVIAWRGDRVAGLVIGAALLLIAPSAYSSGHPGDAEWLGVVRYVWQMKAASYRFFFPVLLLHFLALVGSRPRGRRSSGLWGATYLLLVVVLASITDLFRTPLAWTELGTARDLRNLAGLVAEISLVVGTLTFLRPSDRRFAASGWLATAILCYGGSGAARSFIELVFGEWVGTGLLTHLNSLTLLLLPSLTLILFFAPLNGDATEWRVRRWLHSGLSLALTCLYGIAVVGIIATVLIVTNRDLGGVEWILFGAVFLATVGFSPLLRVARQMVEQHMWTRWARREEHVAEFARTLGAELEPERIALRVEREVPHLLECPSAMLVITREAAGRWRRERSDALAVRESGALAELLQSEDDRDALWVGVGTNQETLGALRIERRADGADRTPPEEALRSLVAQAVSAALRNSEAHLALMLAQQELAEAERIASIGALGGGLAHEIKNPLAGLKMGLHILQRDGIKEGRLVRMESDVRRIDDLVSGLLRHTRADASAPPERVAVGELVRAAVADLRPLAEDRGISLLEEYPEGELHVSGGPAQLRLVVSNLVVNALDAVAEGDVVQVSVSSRATGEVEIAVRDTGSGIPNEIRERVFEADFTTKSTGSGLGLTIARREIERMGGRITAEGAEPYGTVLRILLASDTVRAHPIHASAAE